MSPTTSACLRRRRLLAVAAASLLALPLGVQAQDYPARPIRLVVPFPPGGPTDVLARIVATRLVERLGQPVVVDNKPGASGMIGADMVAKAAPDGYTLLANASIHVINPSLYPKTSYDAIADFAPVSNLADVPLVLAVHPKLSARSVKDLVALAKSSKPPLAFASAGNATSQHLSGEAFKMAADVDMLHVPYKGSAPALTDLIGGHVQLMFDSLPSSMPHLKAGTIRPLAVTTPKRSSALPEVPTVAESGYPGFAMSTWYGVWAPALAQVGLRLEQIDVIELNEAFAAQGLAVLRQLGLPDDDPRVNAWGGAIALGHPLGASGARLATTAVNRLHETGGRYAIAMMCIGVGQGIAVVMERT